MILREGNAAVGDYSLDEFQSACGVTEPLRLKVSAVDDPSSAYVKLLHHPFAVVGRHNRADLFLDHDAVSRRHAYLQVIQGRVFCVDLGSRTGVHWQGAAAPAGWLDPRTPVAIGPFRLELLHGHSRTTAGLPALAPPTNPLAPPPPDRALEPPAALQFRNRMGGPVSVPLDRWLTLLGTSPICKPRLTDSTASRFQCSLLRTPRGLWVVDLLGRNGVQVGRDLVRFARLDDRDELRIARYIFHVSYGEGAAAGYCTELARGPAAAPPLAAPAWAGAPRPGGPAPAAFLGPWLGTSPDMAAAGIDPQLLSLVQQFGQMQQQMFEQFQQSMLMMFQMFGTLHRDQLGVVQEELAEIRRLSEQLAVLQQAAADPRASAGNASREASASSHANGAPRGVSADDQAARPAGSIGWEQRSGNATPRTEDSLWEQLCPGAEPLEAQAADPEAAAARAQAGAPPHGGSRPPTDEEIHALLCQRIAQIQNERQTRWQRIMSLVTGN